MVILVQGKIQTHAVRDHTYTRGEQSRYGDYKGKVKNSEER